MAPVQGVCKSGYARTPRSGNVDFFKPPLLHALAYAGSASTDAGATLGSGGLGCSGVFLVKNKKFRQADVEDFLLPGNDFVTL